jgi:DNA-directed RNA polymerase specialized sigma24 family protein
LPAHYLEVVLLRDFEELTIAEIAEHLGENQGAVRADCTVPANSCGSIY